MYHAVMSEWNKVYHAAYPGNIFRDRNKVYHAAYPVNN